jgi:hypothetical protein
VEVFLQGLEEHMIKTKLVMREVLSERSVLESCCCLWDDLLRVCRSLDPVAQLRRAGAAGGLNDRRYNDLS